MTTWTPKTKQAETWTSEAPNLSRAFDPYGFSRLPDFDTGSTSGVWDAKAKDAETWTNE